MSTAFRSFHLAIVLGLLPTLHDHAHAADWGSSSPKSSYYGDANRRALDGSYRETPDAAEPTWGSIYLGATVGAGLGAQDETGPLLGAHFGYMARFDQVGLGAELDGVWSRLSDSSGLGGGARYATEIEWLTSLRARAGVHAGPLFVYATAGLAAARSNMSARGPGFSVRSDDTRTGFVWGAGVEVPITSGLELRLEGLRYEFGDDTYATPAGNVTTGGDVTTFRAGFTLELN